MGGGDAVAAEEVVGEEEEEEVWSSGFNSRSHCTTTPRKASSPQSTTPSFLVGGGGGGSSSSSSLSFNTRFSTESTPLDRWRWCNLLQMPSYLTANKQQQLRSGKRKVVGVRGWRYMKRVRGLVFMVMLMGLFFLVNWWMLSHLQEDVSLPRKEAASNGTMTSSFSSFSSLSEMDSIPHGSWSSFKKGKSYQQVMYGRLLGLAAHAMAEGEIRPEPSDIWEEPLVPAASWTPCADQRDWEASDGQNGYILVSANGGINQQRVAICNAVAIARMLNSTLVIPKFLYNTVWRDGSQFKDIYQEEYFINYLKSDIRIVKELPKELSSLDLEAIGSLITDEDVMKEAKPSYFMKKILPILLRNRVVHFTGFGNRLAFDPIPFHLQRLRCRCNFYALQFVNKIQKTGAFLVKRMRRHKPYWRSMDRNLLGPFAEKSDTKRRKNLRKATSRYLAMHLRFEIDMAAYSLCDFGGGKEERDELEQYRAIHFPALTLLKKHKTLPSAETLRSEGKCPLTPEEAVLMLAALGFKRSTHIYIAGAQIYGGRSRKAALTSLYPNLVTKETLLSSSEIQQFRNFSSQLAALDFIVSAAADAFAMTDSGSQLSSLVSGYRMYYGGGKMPTIRPNKRRLANIFLKNSTIEWKEFEQRMRKAVRQTKKVIERPIARSVYRHPRCLECMCKLE
ncbi:Uncharacterized protein QJS10_CPB21g01190 [Acorus calamus]|uniref:O-fucosyltransferase family protein n=1 Tax=Acorus calamus TaxID=4465 RepID=A0AAV9C605_ACOCL|nr:Uncharacterized protein QJS10_CPB21g01190 [Acorus calamus]